MIIKLMHKQIKEYWDLIKYALIKGDSITPDHRHQILNNMLHGFLCENAQCFFRFGTGDRKIQSIVITTIQQDKLSLEKFLYIQCLYSFRIVNDTVWQEDWDFVESFARKVDCKYILANSSNPRIFGLIEKLKIKEFYRTFIYDLK